MKPSFSPEDILLADRSLFPFLYRLKEDNPSLAFKLIDEDRLLDLASFQFAFNPIPSLLVRGFSYPNAKRYCTLLRLGLANKYAEAKRFLDSLGKEGIAFDPLGKFELSAGRIFFLEKQEDIELHRLLMDQGFEVIDLTIEDLGVRLPAEERKTYLFKDKFSQYCHIFASLREKLIEDPTYAKRCHIQIGGFSDVFFASQIGTLFGIECYYRYKTPILSDPSYTCLYQALRARGSLSLTQGELESDEGKLVEKTIRDYRLAELDAPRALIRLYEILSSLKKTQSIGEKGILLSDSFSVSGNKDIYLTCFQDGPFYQCYSDEDVFDDAALLSMGFNPSYVKTSLEKRNKVLYLRLNHFALISRVKEHLDEKIYDSPLLKELGFKQEAVEKLNVSGIFTSKAAQVMHAASLDEAFYQNAVGELKSYDSRFQGIKGYEPKQKKRYSVTNLESYLRCPYAYYMKTVLPQARFDHDTQYLGILAHKLLERVHDKAFDFDASFLEAVGAYKKEMEKYGEIPGSREEVIFDVARENLRRICALLRSQSKYSNLVASYSEKPLSWTLEEDGRTYEFFGIADFIGVYQNGPLTFFTIADYKTGSEEFLPFGCFLGASTQLPLYAYALTKGECKGEIEGKFAGMGMQRIYPYSLKSAFNDSKTQSFSLQNGFRKIRLEGVYLNDESFWSCFDATYEPSPKSESKVGGYYAYAGEKVFDLTGNGNLSGISGDQPYSLDELILDAVRGTLDCIHAIEKGRFDIAPSPRNPHDKVDVDSLPCAHCSYADICYRDRDRDARSYRKEIETHFKKKEGGKEDAA